MLAAAASARTQLDAQRGRSTVYTLHAHLVLSPSTDAPCSPQRCTPAANTSRQISAPAIPNTGSEIPVGHALLLTVLLRRRRRRRTPDHHQAIHGTTDPPRRTRKPPTLPAAQTGSASFRP